MAVAMSCVVREAAPGVLAFEEARGQALEVGSGDGFGQTPRPGAPSVHGYRMSVRHIEPFSFCFAWSSD